MNTKNIKDSFLNRYTVRETEFIETTGFKELLEWDASGRDDVTTIYIGKVGERYFYYRAIDNRVWADDWGFLDEIGETK